MTPQLVEEDEPAPETEKERPSEGESQEAVCPRTQGRRAFQGQRN